MGWTWQTKLIHSEARAPEGFESLTTPVHRASTTIFANAAAVHNDWDVYDSGYTYGLYGTPTTLELAARICELENGYRTLITPSGQAAICLIDLAFLKAGEHVLIPQSIYGPNRRFANNVLRRYGVEVSYYDPLAGDAISSLIKENTRLVWCESPGSITMEVQDVPAICKAAHARGAMVALDNTWSAGIHFDAFEHGVDITMQALTKYVGGHSDLLLGSVTVKDSDAWQRIGSHQQMLGYGVSPDDCSLALRGLKTLAVRLRHVEESALRIAKCLAARPEIERVLHPALNSCPGHASWARDFSGSTGVFSIVFRPEFAKEQVLAFVDALKLFQIGFSWAGATSLAVPYDLSEWPARPNYQQRIVRFSIGLEGTDDLLADLEQAFRSTRPC